MKMRLQLDLSETRVKALDALMKECDIVTRKELFNNALALLQWAVDELKRGNIIASVSENEERYRELQMPIFANIVRDSVSEKEVAAMSG